MDEPQINKSLWTDSPEWVALQERMKELDELADILMAVIASTSPVMGEHLAKILLSRVHYLRERLKE